MNAGGVPNTCKSHEKVLRDEYSGARVSNTWERASEWGITTGNCS